MPHEVLESRERDAGAHHVRSESMAEAMRVGRGNLAAYTMMAEQRAKASGRDRLATPLAF
jgi:hypothetical protein